MSKPYVMHVISGTHWDREWRHTAEQSKPRLIELVDSIIEVLERRPEYKSFCLDGGSVVLEDYLAVRPENRSRVEKLVRGGRITLVNWYTLPETFTVAPEALIRNIKKGRDMAREFGGHIASGYTATSYGQLSQTPQIYNGFGINNIIFYRGTHKDVYDPLFSWEGKDGSKLFVLRTFDEVTRTNWFFYVHQPLVLGKPPRNLTHFYSRQTLPTHMCDEEYYERAFVLLKEKKQFRNDPAALKKALGYIVTQAKPYMVGPHLLAMNMEDNDVPFDLLPEMIDALNGVSDEFDIRQSTIDEYMAAILEKADHSKLKRHHGEIRFTTWERGCFNSLLAATHTSRIRLKILNERAETKLMYHAEPLAAFLAQLGGEYPKSLLDRAWQHLLLNHAHDSICGAAVDKAHADMLVNFSVALHMSEEVCARSIMKLMPQLNLGGFAETDHTVTVFNTLPYARQEVMQLTIDLPSQCATEDMEAPGMVKNVGDDKIEFFDLVTAEGREIPYELLSAEPINMAIERDLDTKGIKMPMVRRRILAQIEAPALGYATYALRPRGPKYIKFPEPAPDRLLLARSNGVLENEFLRVQINPQGTFSMLHKPTGHQMENLHYFTDSGEVGDAHLSFQPMRNPIMTNLGSVACITMLESNTMRGIYRIDSEITVPAAATLDKRDRLREEKTIPLTTWLTLEKGTPWLKIRVTLDNAARDHRLQVNYPSRIQSNTASVESAFAIDQRDTRWTDSADNRETSYTFHPMQNFVDLSDGQLGLAVLNQGMREYEIRDDAERTIALTLLRTQRAYMTANGDMTPDEFDHYTGLHSFGTHDYHYALYPHTGDWCEGGVLQAAYRHKVAPLAVQSVPHGEGGLPASQSFITLLPSDKLMVSAVKQADDGRGMLVRVWNTTAEKVKATLQTTLPARTAALLKLDETVEQELTLKNGKVEFTSGPHKISTILLQK